MTNLLCLVIMVLFISETYASCLAACVVTIQCPAGYARKISSTGVIPNSCYKLGTGPYTYAQAVEFCAPYGLVEFNTAGEANAVGAFLTANNVAGPVFTGYNDCVNSVANVLLGTTSHAAATGLTIPAGANAVSVDCATVTAAILTAGGTATTIDCNNAAASYAAVCEASFDGFSVGGCP